MQQIIIQLIPSRWQSLITSMVALLCFSSVLLVELGIVTKGILSCVIVWRYWHYNFVQSSTLHDVKIKFSQSLGWTIQSAEGEWESFVLEGKSVVHPWCTVLYFSPCGEEKKHYIRRFVNSIFKSHCYFITPDRLDKELFRQLRVYLKWGRVHELTRKLPE